MIAGMVHGLDRVLGLIALGVVAAGTLTAAAFVFVSSYVFLGVLDASIGTGGTHIVMGVPVAGGVWAPVRPSP